MWNIHLVTGTIYTKVGFHPTWNTVMLLKFKITVNTSVCECCLFSQLYPILCDPMDCSPPGSAVHGDSPGKNSRVGLPWPPPRDLPNQGSNPRLPHCRQIVYHLSHQGSPWILEWVAYPFSRGFSWPRNPISVSCLAGSFFTSWATREALTHQTGSFRRNA